MCQNVAESGTNMCQNMCLKKPSRITTERAFPILQSAIPQNLQTETPPRRRAQTPHGKRDNTLRSIRFSASCNPLRIMFKHGLTRPFLK